MTLQQYFKEHKKAAIAFSGGVDSAYLLYAAAQAGCDVKAYFVKGAFQPEFELEDARKLAAQSDLPMTVIKADILAHPVVTDNPANRCYFCKQIVFNQIINYAKKDGYDVIWDGTNASDDAGDRPGMKALTELSVCSPLRICGLTKSEVREKSREAGLFTWDKPSYACLATRIAAGEKITAVDLEHVEAAEGFLHSQGFSDFRVRLNKQTAKLQITEAQMPLLMDKRAIVYDKFKEYFTDIVLDLEPRKGSD